MMKLVDIAVLETVDLYRVGSNPTKGTKKPQTKSKALKQNSNKMKH